VNAVAVLAIVATFLIPLASAGLSVMNTGLNRSRSAAHTMLACLCAVSSAALAYFIFGGHWTSPGHRLFLSSVPLDGSSGSVSALFDILAFGVAALIPVGAGADRWRLGAICISAALAGAIFSPFFTHLGWHGGWLAENGFIDSAGAGAIHVTGGLTALAITWIAGARRGKYVDGMPAAIPGHDAVLVLFGCLLCLPGWIGMNCAGALLFNNIPPGAVVKVAINTILCAAPAALAAAAVTRTRYGRPDASLCANGWVGGLVASSAVSAYANPAASVLIGLIAGALVALTVELLDVRLMIDDPGGVISVHAAAGMWGLLAAGLFGPANWVAQLAGVAILLGFVFPIIYGIMLLLNRYYPLRVVREGDRQGMDLFELGAGAYPEFVTHHEDFLTR
jgi:Amt family ammonium transporter